MVAAVVRAGGGRVFRSPALLVEVWPEVRDVTAIMPDMPPPPLPRVLLAQGLELRFYLPMMVHILSDLHLLGGSIPLGPGVALLTVPLQPFHEATDDGKAGLPSLVRVAGHETSLWLWVWLLIRKLQELVDVGLLLLLIRILRGLVDVRVLLGTPRWT